MTARLFSVVALTPLLLASSARAGDDAAGAIKGIWAVETMSFDGVKVTDDPTAGPQLTAFDGTNYVQRKGSLITEEGTYELDPSKSPKSIDFVITKGPDAGKRQLGIYEVDSTTLRVCVAEPGGKKRPKGFDSGPGSRQLLVVTKRFRP